MDVNLIAQKEFQCVLSVHVSNTSHMNENFKNINSAETIKKITL